MHSIAKSKNPVPNPKNFKILTKTLKKGAERQKNTRGFCYFYSNQENQMEISFLVILFILIACKSFF